MGTERETGPRQIETEEKQKSGKFAVIEKGAFAGKIGEILVDPDTKPKPKTKIEINDHTVDYGALTEGGKIRLLVDGQEITKPLDTITVVEDEAAAMERLKEITEE